MAGPESAISLNVATHFLGPSLGEPFDDPIGEQGNGSRDDDRANEHGGINIPTLFAKRPTALPDATPADTAPGESIFQSIFSQPDQRQ